MSGTERIASLEALRVLGLFAVIVIHVQSVGLFGTDDAGAFILSELARFAVPVFFVLSGMFWRPEAINDPIRMGLRLFVRLMSLFALWVLVYLALDHSEVLGPSGFEGTLPHYLAIPVTGGPGYHLWFLPALLMGSVLCWLCLHLRGLRATILIAVLLYAIGLVLGMVLIRAGYRIPDFVYRNGIFEAPLFLMMGYVLQLRRVDIAVPVSLVLILLGAALHVAEGIWRGTYPVSHDYSFGTVAFALGLVTLFLKLKVSDGGWGRHVLGGYVIHMLFILLIAAFLPFSGTAPALVTAAVVFFLSLGASKALKRLSATSRLVSA